MFVDVFRMYLCFKGFLFGPDYVISVYTPKSGPAIVRFVWKLLDLSMHVLENSEDRVELMIYHMPWYINL